LPNDFSIETGELSNTLKLKRKVIVQKYQDIINHIFSSEAEPVTVKKQHSNRKTLHKQRQN